MQVTANVRVRIAEIRRFELHPLVRMQLLLRQPQRVSRLSKQQFCEFSRGGDDPRLRNDFVHQPIVHCLLSGQLLSGEAQFEGTGFANQSGQLRQSITGRPTQTHFRHCKLRRMRGDAKIARICANASPAECRSIDGGN